MMLLARQSREAGVSKRGQGLVEYALILVLVAIVVLAVLMILGPVIGGAFSTINNSLVSI
jgi:pilus assembly protein Flp/PilA